MPLSQQHSKPTLECVQNVTFECNHAMGMPTDDQVVGVSSDAPRTIAYAVPQRFVYRWPSGGFIRTAPKKATTNFLRKTVAPVAEAMRRAQQVCLVCFQITVRNHFWYFVSTGSCCHPLLWKTLSYRCGNTTV